MALGGADLNLLVALRVLLEEGNVTHAGERLRMSQPAMSGALARLRRQFDDDLLVRRGRDYELTPFAVELLPEVQDVLQRIGRAMQVDEEFDPATSRRTFRITMSDYALAVLHEPLHRRVQAVAPGVRLIIDHLGPHVRESDHVLVDYDIMIGPLGYGMPGVGKALFSDRMVCIVDPRHTQLEDGMVSQAEFEAARHVVASFGRGNLTPVDRVLGERGIQRRAQLIVSGWLPVAHVVEGTPLIGVLPERLADLVVADGALTKGTPPFGEVLLCEGYWFAATRQGDIGHRWLCDRLDEVAQDLALPGLEPSPSIFVSPTAHR